jgi:hypothetical protein
MKEGVKETDGELHALEKVRKERAKARACTEGGDDGPSNLIMKYVRRLLRTLLLMLAKYGALATCNGRAVGSNFSEF